MVGHAYNPRKNRREDQEFKVLSNTKFEASLEDMRLFQKATSFSNKINSRSNGNLSLTGISFFKFLPSNKTESTYLTWKCEHKCLGH